MNLNKLLALSKTCNCLGIKCSFTFDCMDGEHYFPVIFINGVHDSRSCVKDPQEAYDFLMNKMIEAIRELE
jgi:hypothetical protein